MTGAEEAGAAGGTTRPEFAAALEEGDLRATARKLERAGSADRTAADHEDVGLHTRITGNALCTKTAGDLNRCTPVDSVARPE